MDVLKYIGGTLLLGFTLWLLADVIKTYIKSRYQHYDQEKEETSMYSRDDRRYDVKDRFR